TESFIRNIVDSTSDLYRTHKIQSFVVINPLLENVLAEEPSATRLEGGVAVPASTIARMVREAAGLSPEALSRRFRIGQTEAERLVPALLVLQQFLHAIRVKQISVLTADLLSGVLHDMALARNEAGNAELVREQVLSSAMGVAEKYHSDLAHSESVLDLCRQLYRALAGFLDLGGRDLLFLEAAAILHDVGRFVSEYAHHKHSAYLVQWAEVAGLSSRDLAIVSLITRYHRKAHPRPQHVEFTTLPLEERLKVTKLAALLRIADALDRSHRQPVKTLRVEQGEDRLTLFATASDELAVETVALRDKAGLFEETTGLKVHLRRELT
ncbi:MAG: HD domain-containing protein, partial [Planctomycetota bacterium]